MKKFIVFFLLVLFSCADSYESAEMSKSEVHDSTLFDAEPLTELWICHNPGTEHHNEICIEEFYPAGCYVPGDGSKFCWLLNKEDCSGKLVNKWQIINCSRLEGN